LFVDDRLLLCRDATEPGSEDGTLRVACTHPAVMEQLQPGHAVWFDDGKIGATVEKRMGNVFSCGLSMPAPAARNCA